MVPASVSTENGSRDALRVIDAATALSGESDAASSWFRTELLPAFACKTAEQLVSERRAEDVLAYLASLEVGVAG